MDVHPTKKLSIGIDPYSYLDNTIYINHVLLLQSCFITNMPIHVGWVHLPILRIVDSPKKIAAWVWNAGPYLKIATNEDEWRILKYIKAHWSTKVSSSQFSHYFPSKISLNPVPGGGPVTQRKTKIPGGTRCRCSGQSSQFLLRGGQLRSVITRN